MTGATSRDKEGEELIAAFIVPRARLAAGFLRK